MGAAKSAAPAKSTKLSARDLIAKAKARSSERPLPSPEALAELKKVLDANDAAPRSERVRAEDAIELLRSYGWSGSRSLFERVIRRVFDRGYGS
jgi:hypothetical protein